MSRPGLNPRHTGYHSGYGQNQMKEKLSQQLENIVRKTQKNLNEGVFKNPMHRNLNSIGSFNYVSATQTPNYRANSMGLRPTLYEQNLSHRQSMEMRLGSGLQGQSFMSQTGMPDNVHAMQQQMPQPNMAHHLGYIQRNDLRVYDGLAHKSNSVSGDIQFGMKRPGTGGQNLDLARGMYNNISQPDQNDFGMEDDEAQPMATGNRPRTSQPNAYLRDISGQNRPGDSSHPLGSGIGAGEVNAMMDKKYSLHTDIQNEIYNKLSAQNDLNQINQDQRQRIFEDIIIQRIKVIQNFVKKQVKSLKGQIQDGGGRQSNNNSNIVSNPVILNSIHNDGMSLELKIKDILRWKMEAYEQKAKLKDDKLIQMEMSMNRQEQHLKDSLDNLNHQTVLESETLKQIVSQMQERMDQHEQNINLMTEQLSKHLQASVTEQVTETMMSNIMPQIDTKIRQRIDESNNKQNFNDTFDKKINDLDLKLKEKTTKLDSHIGRSKEEKDDLIAKIMKSDEAQDKNIKDLDSNLKNLINKVEQQLFDFRVEISGGFGNQDPQMKFQDIDDQLTQMSQQISNQSKTFNSLENQVRSVNQIVESEMVTEDTVASLIDDKLQFTAGQFINKDQFNTMSEVFSDQFKEFKLEVNEMMAKQRGGAPGFSETAQSSVAPGQFSAPSQVDTNKVKDEVLGSKALDQKIELQISKQNDQLHANILQEVDRKLQQLKKDKKQDLDMDAKLNEFEIEFEDKLIKLEEQIMSLKVASEKPGKKIMYTEESNSFNPTAKEQQEQSNEVFTMDKSKNKPVEVRSSPPKRRSLIKQEEQQEEPQTNVMPAVEEEQTEEVMAIHHRPKKKDPIAVRSKKPAAAKKKADDKSKESSPAGAPAKAQEPFNQKNNYFQDDDDDGIEEIPLMNNSPQKQSTSNEMTQSPQKPVFSAQHMEMPTPSSTSKLEKVQPVDHSFTPATQQQQEMLQSSVPRAQRYAAISDDEEEQVRSNTFIDDYHEDEFESSAAKKLNDAVNMQNRPSKLSKDQQSPSKQGSEIVKPDQVSLQIKGDEQKEKDVWDDDDDDDVWGDDVPELEDNAQESKKVEEPLHQTVIKQDTLEVDDDQFGDSFDDVFASKPKKINKDDALRSGVDFGKKDDLKNMLNQEQKPAAAEEEAKKKVPDLPRVALITNPLDWKMIVPDKAQFLKNIESAVDNQVQNMVIDLMNDYNNVKSLQYDDISRINRELKDSQGGQYSPRNGMGSSMSRPKKPSAQFDLMDDLNALQEFEDSMGEQPKSERKNRQNQF